MFPYHSGGFVQRFQPKSNFQTTFLLGIFQIRPCLFRLNTQRFHSALQFCHNITQPNQIIFGFVKTLFGMPYGVGQLIMIPLCLVMMYLAIVKGFEPLLLLPIGFGGLLANCPLSGVTAPAMMHDGVISFLASGLPVMQGGIVEPGGFLYYFFKFGIDTGVFPIMIFMGVGAMTDFGPLIANPKMALLGGAAQFGIFFALFGALGLAAMFGADFFGCDPIKAAASIGIIGGADGPTAIWLTSRLAPDLLGAIAVAAYSYMALVPIIQPPIMKALTSKAERAITMPPLREVKKIEKVCFPLIVLLLCAVLLPSAVPLIGALMLGNLAKEAGPSVARISDTATSRRRRAPRWRASPIRCPTPSSTSSRSCSASRWARSSRARSSSPRRRSASSRSASARSAWARRRAC